MSQTVFHASTLNLLVAKRAYLQTLMSPPPLLMNSNGVTAKIRPYEGEDAANIISSVLNRPRSRSNAGGGSAYGSDVEASNRVGSNSPLGVPSRGHRRHPSGSNPSSLPPKPLAAALYDAANGGPSPAHHLANALVAEAINNPSNQSPNGADSGKVSPLPSRDQVLAPSPQLQAGSGL